MYKVRKEKGRLETVSIENTETSASINLGNISMKMLDILKEAGYSTEEETLMLGDKWDIEISNETKDKLAHLALQMKRPNRSKQAVTTKKQPVDVLDLIFGIDN